MISIPDIEDVKKITNDANSKKMKTLISDIDIGINKKAVKGIFTYSSSRKLSLSDTNKDDLVKYYTNKGYKITFSFKEPNPCNSKESYYIIDISWSDCELSNEYIRNISEKSLEVYINKISDEIISSAMKGYTQINKWVPPNKELHNRFVDAFRNKGYTVNIQHIPFQFIPSYVYISWE